MGGQKKTFLYRYCQFTGYTIKSCFQLHMHGYGTILDNHCSRVLHCSVVYQFLNKLNEEYDATKLENPRIRVFTSTFVFNTQYKFDPDYLMDEKVYFIEEQEYHFQRQRKETKNIKTVIKIESKETTGWIGTTFAAMWKWKFKFQLKQVWTILQIL